MNTSVDRIIIATHRFVTSPGDDLRHYLLERSKEVLYLIHSFSDKNDRRSYRRHDKGSTCYERMASIDYRRMPEAFVMAKNMMFNIISVLRTRKKWSSFIGMDGLNTISGLVLRRLGLVRTVVYWTTDFTPIRFESRWRNAVYHSINKFSYDRCNLSWNLSPVMIDARSKAYRVSHPEKEYVVPRGAWSKHGTLPHFSEIQKHTAVFLGHLLEKQGVQLALEAIPLITKKIPDFKLVIIGGGSYGPNLRKMVDEMGVGEHVEFKGIITDHSDIEKMMSYYAIGLAPYDRKKDTWTAFSDPGKIKEYTAAGLPILMTDLPFNANELQKSRCAIIIKYDKQEFAEAIVRIMSDEILLQEYRKNALNYSLKYEWGNIFRDALNLL